MSEVASGEGSLRNRGSASETGGAEAPGQIELASGIKAQSPEEGQLMQQTHLTAISEGRWLKDADLQDRIQRQKAAAQSWPATLLLSYTAIGVALGDIGTSPIYTLSAVFSEPPTEDEVLGAASIIFWALTLVVICKYVGIALMLDDHGEGGTFALMSLIARYCGFIPGLKPGSPTRADLSLERYSSNATSPKASKRVAKALRTFFRTNRAAQIALLLLVLLMTAMVIGDGVLTPAQTVLGAFGALQVKAPSLPQSTIAGISMGVLAILFLAQPLGTHKIGVLYAPILILWFIFNIVVGIHNIAVWYPPIFKVINPYYLYVFFRGRSNLAWQQTATCFLALTGAEASYADLGHFTRSSIRIAFLFALYPSVILCYFGQASWMIKHPEGFATSFFSSIPWGNPFFYTYFVIAIGAACVASQTMVSAAFSIVRQSMALACFPRCTVIHTSHKVQGQIWIPLITVFMMVFTIAAVGIFQNSVALGFSYGVCVSTLMIGTDMLIALAMIVVWELPLYVPAVYLTVFGSIDCVFWTANLTKIPKGGWFAIVVASIIGVFSYIWFTGTALKRRNAIKNMSSYHDVIQVDEESKQLYEPAVPPLKSRPVQRLPGIGFFYTEHSQQEFSPTALKIFVRRLGSLPDTTILVTIRQVPVSSVLPEERLLVRNVEEYPGIYHVVARYGYTDIIDQGPVFVSEVINQVRQVHDFGDLEAARVLYVTIDAKLKANPSANIIKRYFVDGIYNTFARLLVAKVHEGWNIPKDELVELGIHMQI